MKYLKNKWVAITLGLILLSGIAWLFRKQLGPLFGGYEKSPKGYYYRFVKGGKLEKIKGPGYHIIFQYVLLGPKGDTLENKSKEGVEQQMEYPMEIKSELDEIFQMAAPGSVIEMLVPTDTLRQRASNNLKVMTLEPGENAKWVIYVKKLLNPQEFEGYKNQRLMDRLAKENKQIDDFALKTKSKNWKLDSVDWIKYYIDSAIDKPRLVVGDEIEFHTEVYTLDGAMLINSGAEGRKYKLTIGRFNYPIVAFDKVAQYMADGESGAFLVTSDYGYGDEGQGSIIAPYTPLLVKIYDLKKLNK